MPDTISTCPSCAASTNPGQKFCFQCGTRLEQGCPACGADLVAGARFCGECGTRVAETETSGSDEAVSEPTPERRLVSVLFCDMVGFTPLSESRDAEEVRELLSRYHATASDVITRYGGHIDKYIGDAVMGVWGTPVTHEDDAERAVRAGLELVTEVARLARSIDLPELQIRVGIATGEAAVLLDAPGQGLIAGDLVNVASRLEALAEPGTVLVDDATHRAAESAVTFEPAGELTLKGKTETLRGWFATQVVAMRRGAGRSDLLEPPFVGRESELDLIKDLFRATARDGRAHLVSVMGVAGIGKSRLIWEFEKYVDGLVQQVYWHQGRSPSYGEGITFWALGEMVRRRAGIAETDDASTTAGKLAATVDEVVPSDDRAWVRSSLSVLLGLDDMTGADSEELYSAWRRFFESLASHHPTVLVFEDLQWADPGLIDFIESLLSWSRDFPLFVVTLARPDLLERRPTWGAGQRSFTATHLEPLTDEEMRRLLEGLTPGLPAGLVTRIVNRSEGVPLYAVETLRMLIDHGSIAQDAAGRYRLVSDPGELAVPETLHALVASRLDSLEPQMRRLVQRAAVLGQTFTVPAVASLVGMDEEGVVGQLDDLVRRQILVLDRDPRSPERGQYGFVQSVIRDVAYGMLSRADRRDLHLRVADRLAELADDELLPGVAYHVVQALELNTDPSHTPELRSRALAALRVAADRAGRLGSHAQELALLEQALALTEEVAEEAVLAEEAGLAARQAGFYDRAEPYFRIAIEKQAARGEVPGQVSATARLADVLMGSGRIEEATELVVSTLRDLKERLGAFERATLNAQLARAHGFRSEGPAALEAADRALAEAGELGAVDVVVDALITRAWGLALQDRFYEALAITEGALRFATDHGLVETEMRARNNVASYTLLLDPLRAYEASSTGIERAKRLGDAESTSVMAGKAVWGATWVGEWDWALQVLDETVREGVSLFSRFQLELGEALLHGWRGEADRSNELVEGVERELKEAEAPQDQATIEMFKALLAAARGQDDQAYRHVLEVYRVFGSDVPVFPGVRTLQLIVAVLGRDRDRLTESLARFDSGAGPFAREVGWHSIGRGLLSIGEGSRDGGVALVEDGISHLRGRRLTVDEGLALGELAIALGPDDPKGQAALDGARRIWADLGASALAERLESSIG